jgi:hypothetical protein
MSNNKNYIEELEDAALEIARMETPDGAKYTSFPLYVAFKSGAKWMRKRMMPEAVETTVHLEPGANPVIEIGVGRFGLNVKDKVKIIIVKEDEK